MVMQVPVPPLEWLSGLLDVLHPRVQTLPELLQQGTAFLARMLQPHGLQHYAVYTATPEGAFQRIYTTSEAAPLQVPAARMGEAVAGGWFFPLRGSRGTWGGWWVQWATDSPPLDLLKQAAETLGFWAQVKGEAQQLELLRQVYYSISDAVVIFDRNSQVKDANPAAERLFGYTVEEMRGMTSAELFPVPASEVRQIGRALLRQGYWHGWMPIRTKSGEERLTEVRVSVLGSTDSPLPIVAVLRDLSEREALRAQAARQRFLLERLLEIARAALRAPLTLRETFAQAVHTARELTGATHIALALVDDDLQLQDFLIEGPGAASLPYDWLTSITREGLETGILGRALRRRKVYFLADITRVPGWREWQDRFPWRSVVVLPLVVGGRPLGLLMVGHRRPRAFSKEDITLLEGASEILALALQHARLYEEQIRIAQERLRAQEQAEHLRRQGEHFLARVSHEMRTPLQAILGYLEWIRMGYTPQTPLAEIAEDLEKIEQASRTLLHLINELLDFQKQQTEPQSLLPETILVQDLVNQVADMVRPLMQANQNVFSVEVHPPDLTMETDRTKLAHVLLNLLSNAAKFTREGRVTLRAWLAPEGDVVFEVADTGIGIPAHALETIFQPFLQADETISHRFGGTGLGLAVVKQYVKLLGGTVHVESEEGKGSVFTVRLPRRVRG